MMLSCSNNNDNNNYSIKDHLEYLQSCGFEFYENLDTFSLKGTNIIDTLNIKYPFFAIRIREDNDVYFFTIHNSLFTFHIFTLSPTRFCLPLAVAFRCSGGRVARWCGRLFRSS